MTALLIFKMRPSNIKSNSVLLMITYSNPECLIILLLNQLVKLISKEKAKCYVSLFVKSQLQISDLLAIFVPNFIYPFLWKSQIFFHKFFSFNSLHVFSKPDGSVDSVLIRNLFLLLLLVVFT